MQLLALCSRPQIDASAITSLLWALTDCLRYLGRVSSSWSRKSGFFGGNSENPCTTIVSTPTTPELEPSGPLWQYHTFSPLMDMGEGQLPDPDEYASDSGVSEGQSDNASSLVSSYLEPEWYESLPYASRSNYLFPCNDEELLGREPLRYWAHS
jgi:hypothetical protein